MRYMLTSAATCGALVVALALPFAAQSAEKAPGPCEQIVAACKNAGFVQGAYNKGYGLVQDCVDPIMGRTKQPAKASKPLPSVSLELVAACKQHEAAAAAGKKGQPKSN